MSAVAPLVVTVEPDPTRAMVSLSRMLTRTTPSTPTSVLAWPSAIPDAPMLTRNALESAATLTPSTAVSVTLSPTSAMVDRS